MATEKEIYPMQRNLDGVYYRTERDGKFLNVCFTDLTLEEKNSFLEKYEKEQLIRMCHYLANQLRMMGDQFDIFGE